MITTYCDIEDYYEIKSTTNILVFDVEIGQEANGGYLIFHGDKLIGANSRAEIYKKDLSEDWVTISVTVKNTPGQTAWASVVFILREDSCIPKSFGPYRKILQPGMDTACFKIKIKLIE